MKGYVTGPQLYRKLQEALDLPPEQVRKATIEMEVDHVAVVTIEFLPRVEDGRVDVGRYRLMDLD